MKRKKVLIFQKYSGWTTPIFQLLYSSHIFYMVIQAGITLQHSQNFELRIGQRIQTQQVQFGVNEASHSRFRVVPVMSFKIPFYVPSQTIWPTLIYVRHCCTCRPCHAKGKKYDLSSTSKWHCLHRLEAAKEVQHTSKLYTHSILSP